MQDDSLLVLSWKDVTSLLANRKPSDNIVDDPDHVCRARPLCIWQSRRAVGATSSAAPWPTSFKGRKPPRRNGMISVFSPFGLGILDIAVGQWAAELAAPPARHSHSFVPAARLGRVGDSQ
jgi:hypothetical protein